MKNFPEKVDGRTKASRRWHELFSEYLAHRGPFQGRHATADRSAAKQAATLTLLLEKMDSQLIRGESVNPEAYARTCNSLERVLNFLGIGKEEPKPDPLKPLQDHLTRKDKEN
jgi:hypothetical protein